MATIIKRKCKICKKTFTIPLSRFKQDSKKCKAGKFCSLNCFYKSPERRPGKGKFGEKSHQWKGGKIYERGYRLVIANDHPNGVLKGGGNKYIREHRLVMEKHLGRYLKKHEIVHHINGNPLDNRIENLMIMSSPEHTKYHQDKRWKEYFKINPKVIKKCIDCQKTINKKATRCISCSKKGILNPNQKKGK